MAQMLYFAKYAANGVFALSVLSFLVSVVTRPQGYDARDALANFATFAIDKVIRATFIGGTMMLILKPFAAVTPLKIPFAWWSVVLSLFAADLIYYWQHRLDHQIRLLWAFHSVHHSSDKYNFSTTVRLPWFGDWTFNSLFYIPAVLIGFDPKLLLFSRVVVLIYQYWVHTEMIGKLGWLDQILITPSNHKVHHGSNLLYLDKNHGGITVIWDRVFRTFQPERDDVPVRFGLTKPFQSYNPFVINFWEVKNMLDDLAHAQNLKEFAGFLFRAPGWQPKRSEMTTAIPAS